jgi:LysM repeat protein
MCESTSKIDARSRAQVAVALACALLFGGCSGMEGLQVPWDEDATHVVRAGDTLAVIAGGYGVEVQRLARVNRICDPDAIAVGRRLRIPDGARIVHRARPGETLRTIADRYDVPVSTIARGNGLSPDATLPAGRQLVMPREATLPPPRASRATESTRRARALLDTAADQYRAANFESAVKSAQEGDALLQQSAGAETLLAKLAFVRGCALAGLGDDDGALASYARVHTLDPDFRPPDGWLSPRLETLYRDARER